MNKTWLKRIKRLEAIVRSSTTERAVFRSGYVLRLPADSSGERHVVVTKTESTALVKVEQCEFEERVGPALGPTEDRSFTVYLTKDEAHDSSPSP
jgi:hypothetical protein